MGNMSIQTRDVVCINRNILALTGASHKGTTSAVLCQLGGDSLVKMGNSPSVNWLAFAMHAVFRCFNFLGPIWILVIEF
jgi:hypothetical protein